MTAQLTDRLSIAALAALVAALGVALAALPLALAAGLLLASAAATLALIDPAWALYAAVLSVPAQELVQLPGGLTVTQAALLLALGALGLHALARPEGRLRPGPPFAALLIFLWALALSAALTPFSQAAALRELARWATVPLIYLLTILALDRPEAPGGAWRIYGLLACLLAAPAAGAAVGLAQFALGIGPESFAIGGGRVRAYGTIGQPNSFAGYMNQAWPLGLGLAVFSLARLAERGWRGRAPWATLLGAAAAAGLCLAALLASFSRGGWLGGLAGAAALSLAALPLLGRELRRLAWRALGAGLGLGLLLAALGAGGLLPDALAGRAASALTNLRIFDVRGVEITPANFAVVERMAHLQAAGAMLQAHPLTGVGVGNFSVAYEQPPAQAASPFAARPWYDSRGHAHNYYLHIAAEAGLIGLAAYLGLIGALAWQAMRALRAARGWLWRGVAIGGSGVIAAVAGHNLFENLHVLNMGLQLGPIWALLVVAERSAMERTSS